MLDCPGDGSGDGEDGDGEAIDEELEPKLNAGRLIDCRGGAFGRRSWTERP